MVQVDHGADVTLFYPGAEDKAAAVREGNGYIDMKSTDMTITLGGKMVVTTGDKVYLN